MYWIDDIINYKDRTVKRNAEAVKVAKEMLRCNAKIDLIVRGSSQLSTKQPMLDFLSPEIPFIL